MILPTPAKHWLKTQYEQWALTLASAFITMKKIWYGSTWVCWAITINIGIPFPKPFKHVFTSREILQLVAPQNEKAIIWFLEAYFHPRRQMKHRPLTFLDLSAARGPDGNDNFADLNWKRFFFRWTSRYKFLLAFRWLPLLPQEAISEIVES